MLIRRSARRSFSILSSFPFNREDPLITFFPGGRGLDPDLNISLAADGLTTRGDTFRNASVRDLFEFSERSSVKITSERALEVVAGPLAKAIKTTAYATDTFPGAKIMDVDEFEGRLASVRDDCLSFSPQLFVEDAAVGSSRTSEIRVRVITDSPIVALYLRALLQRTPLYNPQVFPRTITVFASTLAREGTAAGRGMTSPFTVVDADLVRSRAIVAAVGPFSLASLSNAIAAAAGALSGGPGGYRTTPFDAHPALGEARADGSLPFYLRDGHVYAPPGEAHPVLLPLRGSVITGGASGATVVLGGGSGLVEGAAMSAGRLYAWGGCSVESHGVAGLFAGASIPSNLAGKPLKGSLIAQGCTTVPLCNPARLAGNLGKVLVLGGGVGGSEALVGFVEGSISKDRLSAALSNIKAGVEIVATEADALKVLGL